jgi:hypothetical protein
MARRRSVTLEMHPDDRVPLGFGHVREHAIAEDACVVDHDVEPPVRVDGEIDEALRPGEVGDVVAVSDGLAAHRLDLGDDVVGRADALA